MRRRRPWIGRLKSWEHVCRSVAVIVSHTVVPRMSMIVRPMLARMIMVVGNSPSTVIMLMLVLVAVLVNVGMRVLVRVLLASVRMLVRMGVLVLVSVQVLVLMIALHCRLLSVGGALNFRISSKFQPRMMFSYCQ